MIRLFFIHLGINFLWMLPLLVLILGSALGQALR